MLLDDLIEDFDVLGFVERFGSTRRSSRTNVCVYPCPICGDSRRDKFYINVSGDKKNGYWNAYCCHDEGRLPRLIMVVEDISFPEAASLIREEVESDGPRRVIPIVKPPGGRAKEAVAIPDSLEMPAPLLPAHPDMEMVFNGSPVRFHSRGIDQYIIDRHGLVVTGVVCVFKSKIRPDLANRLVIPIYSPTLPKSMVSWQARDLTGKSMSKYVFPTEDTSKETLYGFTETQDVNCLVLVEGAPAKWAFDRLGRDRGNRDLEHCAIASFGKSLSEDQHRLIVSHPSDTLVIAWDLDASSQIHKIAQKLNGKKKVLVMIPSSDGRDWDELTQDELIRALVNASPYSFSLAARLRARQTQLGK